MPVFNKVNRTFTGSDPARKPLDTGARFKDKSVTVGEFLGWLREDVTAQRALIARNRSKPEVRLAQARLDASERQLGRLGGEIEG